MDGEQYDVPDELYKLAEEAMEMYDYDYEYDDNVQGKKKDQRELTFQYCHQEFARVEECLAFVLFLVALWAFLRIYNKYLRVY